MRTHAGAAKAQSAGKENTGTHKKPGEWLVSARACKGCMYYGYLAHGGTMCCNYTYMTGRIRHNKPSQCEVKTLGKRPRGDIGKII